MKSTEIIEPAAFSQPIAAQGSRNEIPQNATGSNLASIAEGFPDITMISPTDGGLPPFGQDFNGLFYLTTTQWVYLQNGGFITFNQNVSDTIGGYPQGAILGYINSDNILYNVRSLIDDNTYNFNDNPGYINGEYWELLATQTSGFANNELSNLTATGLSQYNVFCINTGSVDEDGNPSFLAAEGGTGSTLTSTAALADLEEFQAITDGSAVISINNETYTISDVDLSAVTSYADIAELLQTAIRANTECGTLWTAATVTYNEDEEEGTGSFILTAGVIGAYDIGYASTAYGTTTDDDIESVGQAEQAGVDTTVDEETTSVIGTDISSIIGWSEATEPTITIGEPLTLTTSGSFDVTTADGTIYTISDTLEYTANDLEEGTYKILIDPINKTISLTQNEITTGSAFPSSAVSGDYLLNTSKIPYDLQQITITTATDEETEEETTTSTVESGLTLVYAGVLTVSGGVV